MIKTHPNDDRHHLLHHHHHHDVRLARISLTLSIHVSLSFIAFGRSSGLHPVSSHSCCMNVRAGRPAFDWPYAGFHRSTSLTISSLLLQQCPVCLVRLACIVFVTGGRWPYSWRRVLPSSYFLNSSYYFHRYIFITILASTLATSRFFSIPIVLTVTKGA